MVLLVILSSTLTEFCYLCDYTFQTGSFQVIVAFTDKKTIMIRNYDSNIKDITGVPGQVCYRYNISQALKTNRKYVAYS
jgi:hypothetical protein